MCQGISSNLQACMQFNQFFLFFGKHKHFYLIVDNFALNRPTFQISTSYDGHASRAVDGNRDGDYISGSSCTHTGDDLTPWWAVDLGKTTGVTSVFIANRIGVAGR